MVKKLLSIVIPAYNESQNIPLIYKSISNVINKELDYLDCEFIFVNDGSKDKTWLAIQALWLQYPQVKWVNFSRNFGKEVALSAGLNYAVGDAILTIDCDGQHPVDKIPEFVAKWQEWYDIVYNKRPAIEWASWIKKITSHGFYRLFNQISEFELESQTTDYRLLDRKVVDVFKQLGEKNRIYRWLIDRIGFDRCALEFDALPNPEWRIPTYNYNKLWNLALNTIMSFSVRPLKAIWYIGAFITFFSFMAILFIWYNILIHNYFGFSNLWLLVAVNTFLVGMIMIWLGLIAVYIAQIHEEIKDRPLFITKDTVNIR